MTPIEAAQHEVKAEFDALARRLGSSCVPEAVVVRVEFDRVTGMPRTVECHEERKRRIAGPIRAPVPKESRV